MWDSAVFRNRYTIEIGRRASLSSIEVLDARMEWMLARVLDGIVSGH